MKEYWQIFSVSRNGTLENASKLYDTESEAIEVVKNLIINDGHFDVPIFTILKVYSE